MELTVLKEKNSDVCKHLEEELLNQEHIMCRCFDKETTCRNTIQALLVLAAEHHYSMDSTDLIITQYKREIITCVNRAKAAKEEYEIIKNRLKSLNS